MGLFDKLFGKNEKKTDISEQQEIIIPKDNHGKTDGELLIFNDFNFKLAVIQVLMYEQGLLKPKFDVYEFAEEYTDRKIDIDTDGYNPIPEVETYFRELKIDKSFVPKVEQLYIDGGNDIYGEICPFWDGEDDYFNITSLTADELKQFPNLKKIEDVGFAKTVSDIFEQCGVDYEQF